MIFLDLSLVRLQSNLQYIDNLFHLYMELMKTQIYYLLSIVLQRLVETKQLII